MLRASGRARRSFFELAGMQDKQKSPPAKAVGPAVLPEKTERLREQAPEQTPAQALPRARRNSGSEQARMLEKNARPRLSLF